MDQRGFTLLEAIVTIAILSVASALSVAVLTPSIAMTRVDSEVKRIVGLMQLARETAITRQRDVELAVDEENGILTLTRIEDGVLEPFMTVALESGVRIVRFEGTGDAPDQVAGEGAVEFGGAERMLFISDGSVVDEADVPVSGAIFLGLPGQAHTARVITLTGTTARPRAYRWNGQWVGQ